MAEPSVTNRMKGGMLPVPATAAVFHNTGAGELRVAVVDPAIWLQLQLWVRRWVQLDAAAHVLADAKCSCISTNSCSVVSIVSITMIIM